MYFKELTTGVKKTTYINYEQTASIGTFNTANTLKRTHTYLCNFQFFTTFECVMFLITAKAVESIFRLDLSRIQKFCLQKQNQNHDCLFD